MAVRRVTHHGGNVIGKFPSIKLARMVCFESTIERDLLYLLDFEPDVVFFAEQPLTIEYVSNGKTLRYTPDFHIVRTGNTCTCAARERKCGCRNTLVECKPSRLTGTDDNRRKFAAAQGWCAERGWDFTVVTDTQLRAGYRLRNIKALTGYAWHTVPPHLKGQVYATLKASPVPLTVGEVAQCLMPDHPAAALGGIWHMAFHHEVVMPLEVAPLSMRSPIALPSAVLAP